MKFPIEKYKIIKHDNEVIAISTYAGKTVKGVAKCDPRDSFDMDKGEDLAIARCAMKIAMKRQERAKRCLATAERNLEIAMNWRQKMANYCSDSMIAANAALEELDTLEHNM